MAQTSGTPPSAAMKSGVGAGTVAAVVVIVALLALGGGVYVGKALYGGSGGSSATKYQYLVVGTNIPFPPFEDYNYTSGAYFGFDINFSVMFANALGRTLVIDNYADFSALLTDVGHGVVDMAASAITESGSVGLGRNASMSFSIPYYDANQAVLVKSSSSLSCAASGCTVADLSSLKIGVQSGTSSEFWTTAYLTPANETGGSVTSYGAVDLEIEALNAGSLDAVIIDFGPAQSYVASSAGMLKLGGEIFTNELYGFAVAHGDPEHILPTINAVITQSMQNGTYQQMLKWWFGA